MALLAIFGDILFIVVPGNVGCNHNIVVIFIPFFGRLYLKMPKVQKGKMNNIKLYQKLGQVVQYSRSELVTFYFDFVRKM